MKIKSGGLFYFFLAMMMVALVPAESIAQQDTMRFMVSFTDKSGAPFQVNNPGAFLSARAIERRDKFGIAVTEQDLPVSPVYLDSLAAMGVNIMSTSRWFNAALIETSDSAQAMALLSLPFVVSVDLLYYRSGMKKRTAPIDTLSGIKSLDGPLMMRELAAPMALADHSMGQQHHFQYGTSFAQANQIGASYLHQLGYTGDSIQIAVLDAGFPMTDITYIFDSLRAEGRILSTKNFVKPHQTAYSMHPHGTYVLSVMGGNVPGSIIGTAPHAYYHLLITEDVASEFPIEEFYWAQGAEYADSVGADIINSSLGYTRYDLPVLSHQFSDMDGKTTLSARAATKASRRGMIVMASAGNGGGGSWYIIGSPADADSILTVGAVDVAGLYAPFSSTGTSADGRVKPDVVATGWNAVVADPWSTTFLGNGTSFSSPILAGGVACLWQANPHMSNHQIMDAVRRSAHQYPFPDTLMGYGIPNLAIAHLILGGMKFPNVYDDENITVAPNPFIDQLKVSFSALDTQQITIELYDLNGRLMHAEDTRVNYGANLIRLNGLDHLAAGVYLLRINSDSLLITRKVIRR